MFYERKIRYFDLYRGGERIAAGGFARTEAKNSTFKLEITGKCRKEISGSFPVLVQTESGTQRLGEIELRSGMGNFRQTCHIGTGEGELPYFDMTGIRIPLSDTEELISSWKRAGGTAAPDGRTEKRDRKTAMQGMQSAEHGQETAMQSMRSAAQDGQTEEHDRETAAQSMQSSERGKETVAQGMQPAAQDGQTETHDRETAAQSMQSVEHGKETTMQSMRSAAQDGQSEEHDRETTAHQPLLRLREEKWEQLCLIYPHISPFRDEREYLSVGPADFVLLSEKSYRAANNSFLLHGYYSYKHLILTRVERRGEILYYIGVPGSYYEKEKQVAVMFGFESFECEEEPARYGDFGYYMMRVCI